MKKICRAIAAMDTPEEEKWIKEAREYIGPELFDSLLKAEWEQGTAGSAQ